MCANLPPLPYPNWPSKMSFPILARLYYTNEAAKANCSRKACAVQSAFCSYRDATRSLLEGLLSCTPNQLNDKICS